MSRNLREMFRKAVHPTTLRQFLHASLFLLPFLALSSSPKPLPQPTTPNSQPATFSVSSIPSWLPEDQRFAVQGTSNEIAQAEPALVFDTRNCLDTGVPKRLGFDVQNIC